MTGSEYWLQREKEWIAARNRKTDKLSEDLENAFLRASDDLQKEIAAWVEKYADAEEITLADARKRLSTGELQRLKMNLEEFTKLAKDNADGRWEKELTSASASVHVTRLQALELQMKNIVRKLYAGQESAMSDFLTGLYADEREHMTYEIQRAKGKFDSLAALPEDRVQKILQRPWADDGQAFSERLWGTQNKLINVMQSELLRGIISGKDTGAIGRAVANRMGAAGYAGVRLIQTETTRLIVESDKDTFKEMGIEQVEIVGTLDRNTCESCGELDGQVMKRSEASSGSTAPPFHPNCRCILVPYDAELSKDGHRTARDPETGKSVEIPDMPFKDWKAVYSDKKIPLSLYLRNTPGADIIKEKINAGKISLTVNPEKQGRHDRSSKLYQEGKSYMTIPVEEIQELVDQYAGTGEILWDEHGNWSNKEVIHAAKEIGVNINKETKEETKTKYATIHYSKTGIHVVPKYPKDGDR